MTKRAVQIPLPFTRFERYELAHFRPGDNHLVLEHLKGLAAGGKPTTTYLWGERGSGKSHLLQAMCTRLSRDNAKTAYVPLEQHETLTPDLLEGMEQLDLVCIDDVDTVAGEAEWERALFNLFNRMGDARRLLILAASRSPNGLAITLPDLRSRLQAAVIFHLQALSETDRVTALKQRADLRGIELTEEVTAYLVRRIPRDTHTLFQLLERMDQASLAAKRKITIPFVRDLLDQSEE